MSNYLYEVHLHTKEASACGHSSGDEYPAMYQKLGVTGFIVTDHFFTGNTAIDRNLPWEEWVHAFCKGYHTAKEAGDRLGIDVFFGWEMNFHGDEYLMYGLDEEWLMAHPQLLTWTQEELFAAADREGALMVQAHPYRERGYLSAIRLHPHTVHAVEIANNGNPPYQDKLAYRYCREECKLPMTVGSDIHKAQWAEDGGFYMEFEERLTSIQDYIRHVKAGTGYRMVFDEERMKWDESCVTKLPVMYPVNER